MIKHYFKVAFRNLWKYKKQTLISVVGLAVGFACFAMASLWIRYETTFDSSLKNSGRMYRLYNGERKRFPRPFGEFLKTTFPETVNSSAIFTHSGTTRIDDEIVSPMRVLTVDSSFVSMFNVKLVEGSMDFTIPGIRKAAITRNRARQLFGNESPVGKIINNSNAVNGRLDYTICAVVEEPSEHSNYPFDILLGFNFTGWDYPGDEHIIIELGASVDVKTFRKKIGKQIILDWLKSDGSAPRFEDMSLIPLTAVYYKDPETECNVKFQHIIIFVIAGSLLILCTLFNYLSLFIARFKIRQKELALRVVFGASNKSLFTLLSVEFLISLFAALLLGVFFMQAAGSAFRETSGIKMDLSAIYFESSAYTAGIVLISLLAFITTLAIFRRRRLSASIHQRNSKLFRKASIVVQLIISIGFMFCTTIVLKQMHHLHNTDLGFKFDNSGSVFIWNPIDVNALHDKIKQIPEITETVAGYLPWIPDVAIYRTDMDIVEWDGRSGNASLVKMRLLYVSEQFLSFYGIKSVEGELLNGTDDENQVLINETAAKALGWNRSAGKSFKSTFGQYRVKGVIQNICNRSPTVPVEATAYCLRPASDRDIAPAVLFKYRKGAWKSCRDKIAEITGTAYPKAEYPTYDFEIRNSEYEYDEFLKSENTLLWLLSLISLVCVTVCV
ncbi:MAG: ABC transporter permease, partial [Prevotellaceae bacterium]|nr:ABC transporter permease [Prevotellaceae bacterium]